MVRTYIFIYFEITYCIRCTFIAADYYSNGVVKVFFDIRLGWSNRLHIIEFYHWSARTGEIIRCKIP